MNICDLNIFVLVVLVCNVNSIGVYFWVKIFPKSINQTATIKVPVTWAR